MATIYICLCVNIAAFFIRYSEILLQSLFVYVKILLQFIFVYVKHCYNLYLFR